jgi:hypothetical protein
MERETLDTARQGREEKRSGLEARWEEFRAVGSGCG